MYYKSNVLVHIVNPRPRNFICIILRYKTIQTENMSTEVLSHIVRIIIRAGAEAEASSTSVGPLSGSWLAACITDITPDI